LRLKENYINKGVKLQLMAEKSIQMPELEATKMWTIGLDKILKL